MKLIRNSWVLSGAVVLGVVVAACSSKTTDNGTGAGGDTNGGGVANGNGGGGGVATGAGGKTSTAATTGGRAATGGSSAIDYCNGLLAGKTCGQTNVEANVKTVNMLLVLDESGSMNDSPASGAASKWEIMKQALRTALPKVENDINFGLLLFPYKDGGVLPGGTTQSESCPVPDDPALAVNVPISGPSALADVLGKVDSQSPGGGTPTATALKRALAYFTTGDGKSLTGTKWVLLATDGGPNCNPALSCNADRCTQNIDKKCAPGINCCDPPYGFVCLDDAEVTSQITQLASAGIKTFVIGVPGTEAYATSLNNFAIAGKVPNTGAVTGESYYAISATSAQQDLIDAFGTITTQLIRSCDFPLKASPNDPTKVNVAIDCVLQGTVPTGSLPDAGVDGYYLDYSQNPAHLKLVGAPCNTITAQGAHHVDVIVGCTGPG